MIRSMRTILCSLPRPFAPTLPYTTLFRSLRPQHQEPAVAEPVGADARDGHAVAALGLDDDAEITNLDDPNREKVGGPEDRKSTRLNSSHRCNSYAVLCLKKKKYKQRTSE